MKKKNIYKGGMNIPLVKQLIRTMKITFLLILTTIVQVSASTYSQSTKLTLNMEDASLTELFNEIERISEFRFFYDSKDIDLSKKISIKKVNVNIKDVLISAFKETGYMYEIFDRHIIVKSSENKNLELTGTVSGKVSDEKGQPLTGVTVSVKGTTQGTTTDAVGNYSISSLPDNAVLIFSFIGMKTQEISVGNQTIINITMVADDIGIDDIVVTALGMKREKKALGYAVGEIDGNEITNVPQENVLNTLTGKVAGLKISNTSNEINASTLVYIRGRTSLSRQDQPLIVIDGIPVGNDAGVISDMNASSIASISVLKGPSAAALYGSRAGNGVIIVTTKTGESNKKGIGVSFNSGYTASIPYHYLELQERFTNGKNGEFDESMNQHWYGPEEGTSVVHYGSDGVAAPLVFYKDQHNRKEYNQTGQSFINDIGVTGSYDKGSFRLSLSDLKANGMYPGSELSKNMINFSAMYKVTEKFKLSVNANLSTSNSDNFRVQDHDDYPYRDIFFVPNHVDVNDLRDIWVDKNIQQNTVGGGYDNPWFTALASVYKFNKTRVYGNAKFDWELTDELSLMGRIGKSQVYLQNDHIVPWSARRSRQGYYSYDNNFYDETNADILLSYNKKLGDFNINVNTGANSFFLTSTGMSNGGRNLTVAGLYTANNVDRGSLQYSSNHFNKRVYSIYAHTTISYKNAVYLDLTARNDWSSTLPENNRSYFYPSTSLSVLISELVDLPKSISLLKVRGGWAEVGKDTDPYKIGQTLVPGNWGDNVTYGVDRTLPNINLLPENTISSEIGLDIALFNNRLGLGATYYKVSNQNQILNVQTPAMSGYTSAQVNAGIVENKGIELELSTTPIQTGDFRWDLNVNFTKDRSKLVKLTEGIDTYRFWESTGVWNETKVGENIGDMYSHDVVRVQEGEYKGWPLLDANGKTQRDPEKKKVGNVIADFFMGMQTSVSYKKLSLSASFDFRKGGQYYSMTMLRLARGGKVEDWHNGISSSTFTGILSNNSFNGDNNALASEIESNPELYRDHIVWVGGRTADLGGFSYNGRDNGSFIPGVISDGNGGYIENFGAEGTTYISAYEIIEPGSGWWSQGVGTDTWIYDASNIKLREITMTYDLSGSKLTKMIRAQNLSLSLYAKNIIVWTKAKNGMDPEYSFLHFSSMNTHIAGHDRWNSGPWSASVGFKLNVQF